MRKEEVNIALLRVPGTNRDYDLQRVFDYLGVKSEVVRMNELFSRKRSLDEFQAIFFPGGFAYGDHIRSGAIWSRLFYSRMGSELQKFVDEGKAVIGICNGMQVLVESGLVPGLYSSEGIPEAAMATNNSAHFECRWVNLRNESKEKRFATENVSPVMKAVIAHGEGKFTLPKERESEVLEEMEENFQVVFRYCDKEGNLVNGKYPMNPNGSLTDIAGISNKEGNVYAWMPHLENACFSWQLPDWTSKQKEEPEAMQVFKNIVNYLEKKI